MAQPPASPLPTDHAPARGSFSPRAAAGVALAVLLILALTVAVLRWVERTAHREATAAVTQRALTAAQFNVATLRRDLEKHRALPFVLAQDPDLKTALATADPQRLAALNGKLEALAAGTGASVIYAVDRRGLTVASSNWRGPDSFVGENYAFRPYYQGAMAGGAAEHFALGTISRRPGLYLSHRLDDAGGQPLGVVVVKVEFPGLEEDWAHLAEPVFVTNSDGVVLLTSEPGWRFRSMVPLGEAAAEQLRRSLQFGDGTFAPLPIRPFSAAAGGAPARKPPASGEEVRADVPGHPVGDSYLHVALPVPSTHWTFHLLAPSRDERTDIAARMQAQALVVLLLAYIAIATGVYARRRLRRHNAQQAAIRAELTARVQARTAELQAANDQLRAEMEERRQAELRLHAAQEELVQANKLTFLGQIAAGVAHEINQPVAAIRSYADNAGSYLERGEADGARASLARIGALTERIGAITGQLRAFARKGSGAREPTPVDDAIEGALLLLGPRLRTQPVTLVRSGDKGLRVQAERLRLEQVLVNLLQNALDAVAGRDDARIDITTHADGADGADGAGGAGGAEGEHDARVRIEIADNGPGIAPEIAERLFTPFSTSKPEGMGLGLVISRDIVAEFGGTLDTHRRSGTAGGAIFTITLNSAP